jgi:hypothetical protein
VTRPFFFVPGAYARSAPFADEPYSDGLLAIDADIADVALACDAAPVGVEPAEPPEVPDVTAYAAITVAVRECLKPRARAILLLYFVHGVGAVEIAKRFGISHQAVRMSLDASIAKLRRHRAVAAVRRGHPLSRVRPCRPSAMTREQVRSINERIARVLGPTPRYAMSAYQHYVSDEARTDRPRWKFQREKARQRKQDRVRQVIERHLAQRAV